MGQGESSMFATACCMQTEDSSHKRKSVPELHGFSRSSDLPRRQGSDRVGDQPRVSADASRRVLRPSQPRDRSMAYSSSYVAYQHASSASTRQLDEQSREDATVGSKACRVLEYKPYTLPHQDAVSFFTAGTDTSAAAPHAASPGRRAGYVEDRSSSGRVEQLMSEGSQRNFGLLSPRKAGIKGYRSPPSTP
mmetsp:Transcript_8610/g.19470  ORF Transcript_8610/g.19470 Transcript_8610/m.19470 type:complete len:192 (-) Transcript_8610:112-687(-)